MNKKEIEDKIKKLTDNSSLLVARTALEEWYMNDDEISEKQTELDNELKRTNFNIQIWNQVIKNLEKRRLDIKTNE